MTAEDKTTSASHLAFNRLIREESPTADCNRFAVERCEIGNLRARAPTPYAPAVPSDPARRVLLGFIGQACFTAATSGVAPKTSLAAGLKEEWVAQPGTDRISGCQNFYGRHQSSIVTAQPLAAIVASFDVLAGSRDELTALMKWLTVATAALMAVMMDSLSMTVAFGASMFDTRFGLATQCPKHLVTMNAFPNDALDNDRCHGDLLIQFNVDTAETNNQALQAVLKDFPDGLSLRWRQDRFLLPQTAGAQRRDASRNLLGFKDGTSNLDANSPYLLNRMVWVGNTSGEPGWTHGGTYQAVRIIRTLVERWNVIPLHEQENIIGRDKAEGAPLGMAHERDVPDYLGDPDGRGVPLLAHIRRVNPSDPGSTDSLILRRGYTYSNGLTKAGELDVGLLFTAFQSDLERGFIAVQTRLNGEPLERHIKPDGGGYFFALPGVESTRDHFARVLLETDA